MKPLSAFSFLLCVLYVNCQIKLLTKDYLIVYEANSNKFFQISLNSPSSKVEIPGQKLKDQNSITRILIEHKNENFNLYYTWFNDFYIGVFQKLKDETKQDKISASNKGIRDIAKDPSQNIFYYTAANLYKRNLSLEFSQEIVTAAAASTIDTLNYNPTENVIYFYACPSTGIVLRRFSTSDNKELKATPLNQCLNYISIDFKAQELFGRYGDSLYHTKLDDKPDLKLIHSLERGSTFAGLAVGSDHLYYTVGGQNIIYKLKRNSWTVEKFYEHPNGKFEALAIFEGNSFSSGPKSWNLNLFGFMVALVTVLVNLEASVEV